MGKKKRRSVAEATNDGGRSPGTYETKPESPRRRKRGGTGGPFLEPGPPYLEGEGRNQGDPGGPFNEPGSEDLALYAVRRKRRSKKKS